MVNTSLVSADSSSIGLVLPDYFLESYGCLNCIWRSLGQCPEGFDDSTDVSEFPVPSYCAKVKNFFCALSEGETNLSAVKEKFHLFLQEMQSMEDFKEFSRLKVQLKSLLNSPDYVDRKELAELEMRVNAYKLWWARLNESVIKGLSRVVDRHERKAGDMVPKLTIQNLNVLLRDSAKRLVGFDGADTVIDIENDN